MQGRASSGRADAQIGEQMEKWEIKEVIEFIPRQTKPMQPTCTQQPVCCTALPRFV